MLWTPFIGGPLLAFALRELQPGDEVRSMYLGGATVSRARVTAAMVELPRALPDVDLPPTEPRCYEVEGPTRPQAVGDNSLADVWWPDAVAGVRQDGQIDFARMPEAYRHLADPARPRSRRPIDRLVSLRQLAVDTSSADSSSDDSE